MPNCPSAPKAIRAVSVPAATSAPCSPADVSADAPAVAVLASDPASSRAQAPIVCLLLPVPRFLGAPAPLRWHVPFPLRRVALPSRRVAPLLPAPPPPSSAAAATSPQPHPRLVGAGGVVAFGATKLRDFVEKVRNYCVKHADFLPNSPSSSTALHTLPVGLVALACTLPGTIRTENLRKTPFSPLSLPRRTLPSQNRHPLQILCKNGGFARDFEGKNERKTVRWGFFAGISRPKRVKNGLKIINRR